MQTLKDHERLHKQNNADSILLVVRLLQSRCLMADCMGCPFTWISH